MPDVVDLSSQRTLHRQLCASLEPEHLAFCLARQEMQRTLRAWLATKPKREYIDMEISGTVKVLQTLVELEPGSPAVS